MQDRRHFGRGCAEFDVSGEGRLVIDNVTTTGALSASGLRYDLGVPNELPQWFVDNHWHELIYAVYAVGFVPPAAPPGCVDGADCLVLENLPAASTRDNKHAVVLSAGAPLPGQIRPAGVPTQYYELDNASLGDDTFIRGGSSAVFNDKVRVVAENRW